MNVFGGDDEGDFGGGGGESYDIPMPDAAPEPDFSAYQGEQQEYSPAEHQSQSEYNQVQLGGFDDGVGSGGATSYNEPSYNEPSYNQSSYSEPSYNEPAYGASQGDPPGFQSFEDGSTFQRFDDGSTLARDTDGDYTSTNATDGLTGDGTHMNPAGVPMPSADGSVVFRGDRPSMDPERVFENGFQPKGTIDDLSAHVARNGAGTNFVSTSRDFNIAQDFAMGNGRNNGFIYQLNGTGGIDTAARLNGASYTGAQSEIAFRGGVPGSQIQGAYPVVRGEVGSFIPNEGYVPPMSNSARATLGGAGGILAYEAINAGLPYAQQGVQALEDSGYTGTAAAIRGAGNAANDFFAGAAPVATGVSSGLQYFGVPQRYADWTGIVADTGVRIFPPTGAIYNPVSIGLGVGNAGIGFAGRNFSGGAGGVPSTGTFTDPMGGLIMP